MSRPSILILLGALIIFVPISGFPVSLRSFLVVLLGVCVLGVGLSLRTRNE